MPWDALPEHINEPHEWDGKDDDDHWDTSWIKSVKGWFAFGPRCKAKWARFREYPKFLWGIGPGPWRIENDVSNDIGLTPYWLWSGWYVSRVQYDKPWHIQLQWPLFVGFHFGEWQGYIGFKRDADRVYWLALYFGKKWK